MSNVHYQIKRFVCIYAPTVVLYEILLYNSTITICTISISWMMILLNSSILFFSNGINTNIQLDLRNFKFTIISLESIVNYFVNGFRMILNILTRSFGDVGFYWNTDCSWTCLMRQFVGGERHYSLG